MASPEAIAAIRMSLHDSSRAAQFLDELRDSVMFPPELIPDIVDLCRSPHRDIRLKAINLLGILGAKARSAVPAIEEILAKNNDPEFEEAARHALEDIQASEPAPAGR